MGSPFYSYSKGFEKYFEGVGSVEKIQRIDKVGEFVF